jgi:hypothetical protein
MVGAFIRNAPFGTEIAFKKGLESLGVEVIPIDTSFPNQKWDQDADATIVFKWMEGCWDKLEQCKGPKILYQPDDYRFPHIKKMVCTMRKYCDFILTFDESAAILAKNDYSYKIARKMLLTADPELYTNTPYDDSKREFDFSFIGSFTGGKNHESRVKMVKILSDNGFNVSVLTDQNDAKILAEAYGRSKITLNHATDTGVSHQKFGTGWGYQCRHFEAGLAGSCLLSNYILDDYDESDKDPSNIVRNFTMFMDEAGLIKQARMLLNHSDLRKLLATSLYEEIMQFHQPKHRALELLSFIEECKCA